MIDLYSWKSANGRRPIIILEETGTPYKVIPIDPHSGKNKESEYLKISPGGKVPCMVDPDGPGETPISIMESAAIMEYLAEKTGQLLPTDTRERLSVLQWLMFQMGGVGPMFGQANHFIKFAAEDVPYGKKRYREEAMRLLGVMDRRLAEVEFLAGDYSIADIATWPWVMRAEWYDTDWSQFPNTKRWYDQIGERPAVQRGTAVPD